MHPSLTFIALACLSLQAQELRTTAKDRVALSATFYQNGIAVVRDTRRIDLPGGPTRLAFADLLPSLRPKSATLLDPGQGVDVLERNYAFDLLSPMSLTKGSLGLPAWLREPGGTWDKTGRLASLPLLHPRMRADARGLARLARLPEAFVQARDENVVVATREGFQPAPPGSLAYTQIPSKLRASPTLIQDLSADQPGSRDLTLVYAATDLTWTASYVAILDPDGAHLDLEVFATVENQSGGGLAETALQLVAGEPNLVQDDPPQDTDQPTVDRTEVLAMAAVVVPPVFKEEKLSEYPLFSLDRPVSLQGHSLKQLVLMNVPHVPLTQTFLVECPYQDYEDEAWFLDSPLFQSEPDQPRYCPFPYLEGGSVSCPENARKIGEAVQLLESRHGDWLEEHHPPVQRLGAIQNRKASNLGRALPEGSLDLRYRDPSGLELPLTEALGAATRFPGAPPQEEIELVLGRARGLQVDRRAIRRRIARTPGGRRNGRGWTSGVYTIEVTLTSQLATAAQVSVREPLRADWKLSAATHAGTRSGTHAYDFLVRVPAHGTATLRYTVRTAPIPDPNQE